MAVPACSWCLQVLKKPQVRDFLCLQALSPPLAFGEKAAFIFTGKFFDTCSHMGEGCPVPWTKKGLAWSGTDLLGGQWAAQVAAGLIDVGGPSLLLPPAHTANRHEKVLWPLNIMCCFDHSS